jgi:hypothetical protein
VCDSSMARAQFVEIGFDQILSAGLISTVIFGASAFVLLLVGLRLLGWEIHSEFRGIPRLFRFRTFWTPEFSSEFYLSDRKMCSRQF